MVNEDVPSAAVALVERADGKVLCVWNKRYGRWSMPGGRVEPGETPAEAARRELGEETGALALSAVLLYEGAPGGKAKVDRGQYVRVFSCSATGDPREREPGCPVTWLTREEFLRWGVVPEFYERVFAAVRPAVAPLEARDCQCEGCGRAAPASVLDGWVCFPAGWFVAQSDAGTLLACSRGCVERLEADVEDEVAP